jgi:Cu-Zn family superoxide dismutase
MRSFRKLFVPAAAAAALALGAAAGGCDSMPWNKDKGSSDTQKMQTDGMKTAVANVKASQAATTQPSWGNTTGTVTFTQVGDDKVKVVVDLQGVPPGKHGFHIHEKGDLSAPDLSSAGGHFNPGGHKHGGPKDTDRHAGDLGNIRADASGNVKKEITTEGISIDTGAANDIVGKSVIVHSKADDLKSQPSGDAGGRIAGGVIETK